MTEREFYRACMAVPGKIGRIKGTLRWDSSERLSRKAYAEFDDERGVANAGVWGNGRYILGSFLLPDRLTEWLKVSENLIKGTNRGTKRGRPKGKTGTKRDERKTKV